MPYTLEVLFNDASQNDDVHVGYMSVVFSSKKNAAAYYDRWNPHMRPLNAHHTWRSDWDPQSRLLYVVRETFGERQTVAPFRECHRPTRRVVGNVVEFVYPKFKDLMADGQ